MKKVSTKRSAPVKTWTVSIKNPKKLSREELIKYIVGYFRWNAHEIEGLPTNAFKGSYETAWEKTSTEDLLQELQAEIRLHGNKNFPQAE